MAPSHPRPRGQATSAFRYDDNEFLAMRASLRRKRRQMLAPLQHPTFDAYQWPETPNRVDDANRSEVPVINYSSINNASPIVYPVKTEKREVNEIKKRPQLPCPCPDNIKPHKVLLRRHDEKRHISFGTDDEVYIKDQIEYCRMMKSKLHEVFYRTTGPLQRHLRARLLAEQTWFELQCKLFLPPPITNRSTFIDVLQKFEDKRDTLGKKERSIWKEVGRLSPPALSSRITGRCILILKTLAARRPGLFIMFRGSFLLVTLQS